VCTFARPQRRSTPSSSSRTGGRSWRRAVSDDALKNQYVEALTRMHESGVGRSGQKNRLERTTSWLVTSSPPGLKDRDARVQAVLTDLGLAKQAG